MKSIIEEEMEFRDHTPLKRLVGLSVEEIFSDGEQLGLSFGTGWRLTIYNRFVCRGAENQPSTPQHLKGALVLHVLEDPDALTLILTGNHELKVDLTNDGFRGPEALQLIGPSGEIVVWN